MKLREIRLFSWHPDHTTAYRPMEIGNKLCNNDVNGELLVQRYVIWVMAFWM